MCEVICEGMYTSVFLHACQFMCRITIVMLLTLHSQTRASTSLVLLPKHITNETVVTGMARTKVCQSSYV